MNNDDDIFEKYGFRAKQYDALMTVATQKILTPLERTFCDTFTAMLSGDASEADMIESWKAWIAC